MALAGRIGVAASFADVDNDGDPDLFVTTVRGGNALFENDGRGRFQDITQAGRRRPRRPFLRRGLLRLRQATACSTSSSATSGATPATRRGRTARTAACRTPSTGTCTRTAPSTRSSTGTSAATGFKDVTEAGRAGGRRLERRRQLRRPERRRLAGPLPAQHAGRQPLLRERSAARASSTRPPSTFPKTPWGSMGIKFFDYDNDGRMDLLLTDMHSDMSEDIGPEREKLKSQMRWADELPAGRREQHLRQRLLSQPGRRQVRGGLGPHGRAGELLALGSERRRPQRRRLGRRLHHLRHGFPVPLRHQLAAPERPGREVPGQPSSCSGIEPRRDGRTHTPWFDLDCSTDEDTERCRPCRRQERTGSPSWHRSAAAPRSCFDLDGDGDLDIVTNELNDEPQVLVSDLAAEAADPLAEGARWSDRARTATGSARPSVSSPAAACCTQYERRQVRLSLAERLPLYFGLGDAAADRPHRGRLALGPQAGTEGPIPAGRRSRSSSARSESTGRLRRETAAVDAADRAHVS